MRNELIEVAAMATADALWNDGRIGFTCKKGDLVAVMKDAATTALDAILARLQDPDEEMREAGDKTAESEIFFDGRTGHVGWEDDGSASVFRAMLEPLGKRG